MGERPWARRFLSEGRASGGGSRSDFKRSGGINKVVICELRLCRHGNAHHQLAATEEIRGENDEHNQKDMQEHRGQEQRPPAPTRQFLFRARSRSKLMGISSLTAKFRFAAAGLDWARFAEASERSSHGIHTLPMKLLGCYDFPTLPHGTSQGHVDEGRMLFDAIHDVFG